MIKTSENVYQESEINLQGDECHVKARVYIADDDGNHEPMEMKIREVVSEPIDDYDDLNFIKYTHDSFSFTAKAKIPIAFIIGIKATVQLQNEFDRKHRI